MSYLKTIKAYVNQSVILKLITDILEVKLSKNKGFSDTSGNRYSLALYELSNESDLLTQVEANSIAFLDLIFKSKDFA